MQRGLLFGSVLILVACAQRYSAPATTQTSAAPEETFQCVRRQMSALGYKQSSLDVDQRRVSGTKIDNESRRPDTQFRRILNKLEAVVAPRSDGQTSIEVQGRTFAEYTTQRGPSEVEERASGDVKAATQQLLEQCRG